MCYTADEEEANNPQQKEINTTDDGRHVYSRQRDNAVEGRAYRSNEKGVDSKHESSINGVTEPDFVTPKRQVYRKTGRDSRRQNAEVARGHQERPIYRQASDMEGRQPSDTFSKEYGDRVGRHEMVATQRKTTGRQPVNTPKRDSPATIAAKEAPGWQMFLGLKSSTVSFTSEEVDKLKASRHDIKARSDSRTRVGQDNNRSSSGRSYRGDSVIAGREVNIGQNDKALLHHRRHTQETSINSSPVEDKQNSLHLSRERSLKSISNWWKSSLDAGPPPPPTEEDVWRDSAPGGAGSGSWREAPAHNHSHSDSGISSLSGRSSCMSPMSVMSSSSGSSSSRTSLRSSSIVSVSNIVLDEEPTLDDDSGYREICEEMAKLAPNESRICNLISNV